MSSYCEGQTHQLVDAFEKAGFSGDDLTSLGQNQGLLRDLRAVLDGKAEITMILRPVAPAAVPKIYLRRLFEGEELNLEASEGGDMIAGDANLFDGFLDADFVNWKLNTPSTPTGLIRIQVDELIADATFAQMFGTIDLDCRRLTQGQIKRFCRKYRAKLRTEGYATFFLFTKNDEPVNKDRSNVFVASVYVRGAGRLGVYVYRFSYDFVWFAWYRHRIVSPATVA